MTRLLTISAGCLLLLAAATPAMAHDPFRDTRKRQRGWEPDRQRLREQNLEDVRERDERFLRER